MKNVKYFNSCLTPFALSNLCLHGCSATDILDAVEDAHTAEEFVNNINSLNIMREFSVDRVTNRYVRLKSVNALGNIHFLQADLD